LLSATDRGGFVSAVRALDRVLMSGSYVVPLFHLPGQWIAHWSQLRHPDVNPLYGVQLDCWWIEASAQAR
jgi:peptide/nickel transport system substrate-binding protein